MPEDSSPVLDVAFTEELSRSLFHDLHDIRNLPESLYLIYRTVADFVELCDGARPENPSVVPLAARYWHPDDQQKHHLNHTFLKKDCDCHPNDRKECDVCTSYELLIAFEGPETT